MTEDRTQIETHWSLHCIVRDSGLRRQHLQIDRVTWHDDYILADLALHMHVIYFPNQSKQNIVANQGPNSIGEKIPAKILVKILTKLQFEKETYVNN